MEALVQINMAHLDATHLKELFVQFLNEKGFVFQSLTLNEIEPDALVRSPFSSSSVLAKRSAGARSSDDESAQLDSKVQGSDDNSDEFLEIRNRKMIRKRYAIHSVHKLHRRDGSALEIVLAVLNKTNSTKHIVKYLTKVRGLSGINVETPYKRSGFGLCRRCQKYEHVAVYCHVKPRCVKCTVSHWTKGFTRTKGSEWKPSCVLCRALHYNYKAITEVAQEHSNSIRHGNKRTRTRRQKKPPLQLILNIFPLLGKKHKGTSSVTRMLHLLLSLMQGEKTAPEGYYRVVQGNHSSGAAPSSTS
ncbi:hypothetical protein EVAR_11884_1 [Eumeta japonica]|uniref:Nucleic-acid-binding protein from transposon X-element n=1 Tax=Eumeta variegata TaxID=151549 RepID=A0A4C1U7T8_EUMVA|nr:hypothetical protein EVAR_11884_1 [Eumeta japonica]